MNGEADGLQFTSSPLVDLGWDVYMFTVLALIGFPIPVIYKGTLFRCYFR